MGDDDDVLTGIEDKLEPWTIKVFSRNMRNRVVAAARDEGVPTGQWLERFLKDNMDTPAPAMPSIQDRKPVDLVGLAEVMRATVTLAEASALPGMNQLAKGAAALVREGIREARGMPPRRAKVQSPPALQLEDQTDRDDVTGV